MTDLEDLQPLVDQIGAYARERTTNSSEWQDADAINSEIGKTICAKTAEIVFDTAIALGNMPRILELTLPTDIDDNFNPITPFALIINTAVLAAQYEIFEHELSSEVWSPSVENAALRAGAMSLRLIENANGKEVDPERFPAAIRARASA